MRRRRVGGSRNDFLLAIPPQGDMLHEVCWDYLLPTAEEGHQIVFYSSSLARRHLKEGTEGCDFRKEISLWLERQREFGGEVSLIKGRRRWRNQRKEMRFRYRLRHWVFVYATATTTTAYCLPLPCKKECNAIQCQAILAECHRYQYEYLP